jgi:enamine deaminase RidA (YjgF/YER057c/UK114 family)
MNIDRKHTSQRMSRIVTHNNTVYLCGQVTKDRNAGIKIQTQQTLEKIETLLAEANSDRNHLLSVTIYLKNMKDFAEMNSVWDNWIEEGNAPARACVNAAMASEELLVEMSVIAAVKNVP